MGKRKKKTTSLEAVPPPTDYAPLLSDLSDLLEAARRTSAKTVNAIMTMTYWEVGRRIVEFEQAGEQRAEYGKSLLKRLSNDLTKRFGRGFSRANLEYMRRFYLTWSIPQAVSGELSMATILGNKGKSQTVSGKSETSQVGMGKTPSAVSARAFEAFPLPWSHYVRLLSVKSKAARAFYEQEALRGGWSIRQLDRQIASQFYERTALSKDKAAMLAKRQKPQMNDTTSADEAIKDPFVLEFLDLKDEYSESDLEDALVQKLESLLLELGGDFAFIGRQRRLRIGNEWYRIDLLFFHRRLRCLVIIDLKLGKFTHADSGQMHMYLNYAGEHWMLPDENPPVGLILCAEKDEVLAHYSLEGLPNKVLAREYQTTLPDEQAIAAELQQTREWLESRGTR